MAIKDYQPQPGQLCQVYKCFDNVYPVEDNIRCFIADPLVTGEIIIIVKADYQDELSSFYIEYLRDGRLYYSYFYEQVFYFEMDGYDVHKAEEPITTFDFPWVICE